jgi:hypothetical protein
MMTQLVSPGTAKVFGIGREPRVLKSPDVEH